MNRKLFLLVLMMACLALPLAAAAQDSAPPIAPAPNAAESEPNDTIATADPITLGPTGGAISPIGDVDYFRLSLSAGQRVYLASTPQCHNRELETALAIYDQNGALLAENNDWPGNNVILRFTAPATGNYFVRVISDGLYEAEEKTGDYVLDVRNVPADEPDDPFASVAVSYGNEIVSDFFTPWDLDWYQIHARPGDVIEGSMTLNTLLSEYVTFNVEGVAPYGDGYTFYAPGTGAFHFVVPYESDYRFYLSAVVFADCDAPELTSQPYNMSVSRKSLYVAGSKAGNVGGVAFGVNDVLARNAAGAWRKVFDGEDVGLTQPLGGVEFMADGSLLLSVNKGQSLPGVGSVKPADIVRFVPTQLGANTQGTFSLYLRGADAGLTTQGERIDVIALGQDGLVISTYGSAGVPQFGGGTISARDEDLLLFHPNGPMPAAGTWETRLNGNNAYSLGSGFSANDLRAATIVDDIYEGDYQVGTRLLFAAERPYRYIAYDSAQGGQRPFTAAPGDLVYLFYHTHEQDQGSPSFWPPIQRTGTLNFPRIISSVSIGPGWNQ